MGNVPQKAELQSDPTVKVIEGKGRTLMSGLGDAHTHLSWDGDLGENSKTPLSFAYAHAQDC